MKKQLLAGVAAAVVAFAAAPAMAQIDLAVGGNTKNYVGWLNQDEAVGQDVRGFDMLRSSELHVNAEGTADNGLVYGFHLELNVDAGDAAGIPKESYMYLASNMGRVNLGSEDGANYLLQVAAPSADANIDGLRQYIQPVNYTDAVTGLTPASGSANYVAAITTAGLDYENNFTGISEKITYLSPVWSGFQFGASYTPDVASGNDTTGLVGFTTSTKVANQNYGDALEGAVRYEGTFDNVGFAVGGGYTKIDNESTTVAQDDFKGWNVGADVDVGAFGVGAIYTKNNGGLDNYGDTKTWVVGADYTTGPFKLGASYLNEKADLGAATQEVDTDRYTGGVIYTAAPGLSFRGSISKVSHDFSAGTGENDFDATSVLGGIQINF